MAEFLRLQDLTRNWAAELANFSRIGGQESVTGASPTVTASETSAQPTAQPPSTMPTSPTTPQEEESPTAAAPSEPSEPSPSHQETEPMDVNPIAAYYDSNPEERKQRLRKEKQGQEGRSAAQETPVTETVHHEVARGEIDLNESAQKRNLMTDEEFDSIVNRVNQREEGESEETGVVRVPEGPAYQPGDRADESQAREEEIMLESPQPEAERGDTSIEEQETEAKETEPDIEVPVPVAPPVVKPKAVKRQLILKGDQKADRPKPTRVSQRCLGKWAASKAEANTAETPVEIESEGERPTPTKPGEELLPATDLEEADMEIDEAPQAQGGQGEEAESSPTAQDESLTQAEEEARYQQARKRKGKAPIQKKSITKKTRVVNTRIVIREAAQRTPPSRRELSDNEYTAGAESASESDVSLKDEEYAKQQLLEDHRELVHPPVERLRYRRWTVDFTDEIADEAF
ncbi:retinitis pigmentosa 1-like 1 protein [Salvia splendens]|uniref:retinitis pigmentosa 1-like 1 protein n=1 Tax=Salvia splendens TaxID=180675 RepID=UPI001C2524E6|nr:retinitis pigmentosa 1-like 1 protein [Salvia splendens]